MLDGFEQRARRVHKHDYIAPILPRQVYYYQFFYYKQDPLCAGSMVAFGCVIVKIGEDISSLNFFNRANYTKDSFAGDGRQATSELIRFMMASWLWIKQRVMVPKAEHVNGSAVKQAQRLAINPSVNVITLRRQHDNGGDGAEGSREWSCQWLVRGHWRQQYYRTTGEHRPCWIEPYVKGPDDKPFKTPSDTVFAVTR